MSTSHADPNPNASPQASENQRLALILERQANELEALASELQERAEMLNVVARRVLKLPSSYRAVPGETSPASTPSPTTPAILMVERSQDVPYETNYPISKVSPQIEMPLDTSGEPNNKG